MGEVKREQETKALQVGLCLPCAMGDCDACEGSTHNPCACRSPYWSPELLKVHAECIGPNPYCAMREHSKNP